MSKGVKLGRIDRDRLKEKLDRIYSRYSPILDEGKRFRQKLDFYVGVFSKMRKFSEDYGTKSMAIQSYKTFELLDTISFIQVQQEILDEITKLQDNHKSIIDEFKKYEKYCDK
jgi:hypothetical protein